MGVKGKTLKYNTGSVFTSKNYGEFEILNYISNKNITIRFKQTGYTKVVSGSDVAKKALKDPYYPSIYGKGYCGEGDYRLSYNKNGKKTNTPAYEVWLVKLKNCYGDTKLKHLYKENGVTVCKEWHNFQVFAEWFYKQVKLYGKGGYVDKDLACLGNREYHPNTARYVPPAVNSLFTGTKGKISGTHFCNTKKKWIAQIQKGDLTANGTKKQTYLGKFACKAEADQAYFNAKVQHVRETALKYQDNLPTDIFYKLYTGAENYVNYYTTDQGGI